MDSQEKNYSNIVTALLVLVLVGFGVQAYYTHRLSRSFDELRRNVSGSGESLAEGQSDSDWLSAPLDKNDSWLLGGSNLPEEMSALHKQMNELFENSFARLSGRARLALGISMENILPSLDIEDNGSEYIVKTDIPGVDKNEIKVELNDRTLRISGKKNSSLKEKSNDGKFLRRERRFGSFERSLALPGPIDESNIRANYDKGILTVVIPKGGTNASGEKTIVVN